MKEFRIERLAGYYGRTTERVEWRLIRIRDERDCGTYKTRREALEWAATLSESSVSTASHD